MWRAFAVLYVVSGAAPPATVIATFSPIFFSEQACRAYVVGKAAEIEWPDGRLRQPSVGPYSVIGHQLGCRRDRTGTPL